jgi:hypothetical protein
MNGDLQSQFSILQFLKVEYFPILGGDFASPHFEDAWL